MARVSVVDWLCHLPDRIELFPLGTLEELPVLMRVPELGPDELVARTQRAEASGGAAASR